jgi:hypothetical protein
LLLDTRYTNRLIKNRMQMGWLRSRYPDFHAALTETLRSMLRIAEQQARSRDFTVEQHGDCTVIRPQRFRGAARK